MIRHAISAVAATIAVAISLPAELGARAATPLAGCTVTCPKQGCFAVTGNDSGKTCTCTCNSDGYGVCGCEAAT